MDLDPSLLRSFVSVHDTGNFTRAAERLHLTQSAVSHQIRRLEEQLGRQLLIRTTRRLTVTEDGQDLLAYAHQILGALDALERRFKPSSISGEVRFGAPENFVGDRLPTLLCQFARAFPSVKLDVRVNMNLDLHAMVASGELDLAVVLTAGEHTHGTLIRKTQLVWVAADIFSLPSGSPLPFAFFPLPCINKNVAIRALEGTEISWQGVFTSPSQTAISAAILSGLAISILPVENLEPGMRIIDGSYGLPPLPEANFSLIWSPDGKTPATTAFGQLICELTTPALPAAQKKRRTPRRVA